MLTLLQLGATHSQQLVTRNQLRKDIQAGVDEIIVNSPQLLFPNLHLMHFPAASCREIDIHTHTLGSE